VQSGENDPSPGDHTLQRKLDAKGFEAVVESLRGFTEEASERALSQALVARYALCPEIAVDVLETKTSLLRRPEMLEFTEASEAFSSVAAYRSTVAGLLLDAPAQTVPLSTTLSEEIAALREWAETRAVPAPAADEPAYVWVGPQFQF
jgi:hypothetical protein